MVWVVLLLSGALEAAWAIALKQSEGFTKFWPSVIFAVTGTASFVGLAYALKSLPAGTAYAIWTGTGAALTAIIGMLWLDESTEVLKIASVGLIVAGVVGLNVVGS